MNSNDHDMRRQAEAERAEREGLAPGLDPDVDRYRLIVRALRQPLEPQLPADFAVRVAQVAMRRNSNRFEDVLVSLLLAGMGIVALLFVVPALAKAVQTMASMTLPPLPWHMVVMAAICIGIVWASDSAWMRAHRDSRWP
ncbi:MAG TPA: hypothetical protein VK660_09000 [Xanthomonadaceae bacterium]|jgi:hypothetical protein|nr:hypothetical protein [Xanthomonadaceae bacterium]